MPKSALKAYQKLQQQILELGLARPGSLVRRRTRCGKPTCGCMKDPSKLHGPYYQWTNKIRGKTVTVRLTEAQARLCSEWVENHRQLKKLLREMEGLAMKETDRILEDLQSSRAPTKARRTRKKTLK